MTNRDRFSEIQEFKARLGWRSGLELVSKIMELKNGWAHGSGELKAASDFVPIHAVTLLEVFTRLWITELIDFGPPYVDNAAALAKTTSVKFDYALALAVHGKKVSLGELLAHSVSINNLGQLASNLSAVIGTDLFQSIISVHDRVAVEIYQEDPKPIIGDIRVVKTALARLFEVRHILTHEVPAERPYTIGEIDDFLDAAISFMTACEERFTFLVHGDYPLTQLDMTTRAGQSLEDAEKELVDVYHQVEQLVDSALLRRTQTAWEVYRDLQSELRSGINDPDSGSIAPMIHYDEMATITRERVKQLRWWLDREEGDL